LARGVGRARTTVTVFLSTTEVITIHDQEKRCALLNRGALEGAVAQPAVTWDGEPLYSTLLQQAAVLLHGICQAHAFEDANKRTAWTACVTFLRNNDSPLSDRPQHEVESLMVSVAEGTYTVNQVAVWLLDRSQYMV